MQILAESKKYIIFNEFETVILKIKKNKKLVQIGDFYGEPQTAAISENEEFCVMGGCGVIVYYLKEPFEEYEYNKFSSQWREWGRKKENEIWIDNLKCSDNKTIEIETENGDVYSISAYDDLV